MQILLENENIAYKAIHQTDISYQYYESTTLILPCDSHTAISNHFDKAHSEAPDPLLCVVSHQSDWLLSNFRINQNNYREYYNTCKAEVAKNHCEVK